MKGNYPIGDTPIFHGLPWLWWLWKGPGSMMLKKKHLIFLRWMLLISNLCSLYVTGINGVCHNHLKQPKKNGETLHHQGTCYLSLGARFSHVTRSLWWTPITGVPCPYLLTSTRIPLVIVWLTSSKFSSPCSTEYSLVGCTLGEHHEPGAQQTKRLLVVFHPPNLKNIRKSNLGLSLSSKYSSNWIIFSPNRSEIFSHIWNPPTRTSCLTSTVTSKAAFFKKKTSSTTRTCGCSKNRDTPKWMIWVYPYFRKHPCRFIFCHVCVCFFWMFSTCCCFSLVFAEIRGEYVFFDSFFQLAV